MSQAFASIDAIVANGRIEVVGVPAHLGGLRALLTFYVNAAWQSRSRVAERARLGALAHDFGRLLAASYLAGKLDTLIAELEAEECNPE